MWIEFAVAWLQLTFSLFATVLLFWLGFSVLLSRSRSGLESWLGGLSLLVTACVFAAHTAMLDYSLESLVSNVRVWWYGGWLALIVFPIGWYLLMLGYSGYWEWPLRERRGRQALIMGTISLALVATVLQLDPQEILIQIAALNATTAGAMTPLLPMIVAYPIYLVVCVWLALDTLQHPRPSGRFMGDLTRSRARPWLVASTLVQLSVAFLMSGSILWTVARASVELQPNIINHVMAVVDSLELLVSGLCAVAVVLTGKAIVSYELLTGNALPRRGFWRQWRGVVGAAAVYSLAVSLSMGFELKSVYQLLIATLLLCLFMSLWSHSAVAENERNVQSLRPLVTSQHFLDRLIDRDAGDQAAGTDSLRALYGEVLGARSASLHASGALTPLVGAPLYFGSDGSATHEADNPDLTGIMERAGTSHQLCVALRPNAGARVADEPVWAVPLWSGGRHSGVLLLGEKHDGGIYTQEEMELARAGAELMLDSRASAALAQKLMELQRERMAQMDSAAGGAQTQLRRTLHDDVLPQLHTAMLAMSGDITSINARQAVDQLASAHRQVSDLLRDLPSSAAAELARLGLIGALQKVLELELRQAFDRVDWRVEPSAAEAAAALPTAIAEVLFYAAREAMRNAARYGRGDSKDGGLPSELNLCIDLRAENGLLLIIKDDGVGLEAGVASQGSGQGMALHSTMMAVAGGSFAVKSQPDTGTTVSLFLP